MDIQEIVNDLNHNKVLFDQYKKNLQHLEVQLSKISIPVPTSLNNEINDTKIALKKVMYKLQLLSLMVNAYKAIDEFNDIKASTKEEDEHFKETMDWGCEQQIIIQKQIINMFEVEYNRITFLDAA